MNAMYLRKSRAEELTDTTEEVLARHREKLTALAERLGIRITDVFEEVVSGESIYARTEMQKLLTGVRAGRYDAVLCMDIDRLGRGGMSDQGVILDAFRDSETLIVTPDKTYDLTDEADEEQTEFKAFMAHREYKMIRKRLRRGLMQTIEHGGYIANPPYGYRKVTVRKMPSLEIVEEEAAFIRYMYDRYLQGVGTDRIAGELNALGSVPRRNAQWSNNTVRAILRNPTYIGKVAWNRVHHIRPGTHGSDKHKVKYVPQDEWLIYDGLHPAIISREIYDRAQEVRMNKHIPCIRTGDIVNPLAGVVICARCGRHMQRMGGNKGTAYILCKTKGCTAGAKAEYVEEALLSSLSDRLRTLKLQAAGAAPLDLAAYEELLTGARKQAAKIDTRIARLYELLEDGTYDRSTFKERLALAEKEKAAQLSRADEIAQQMASISKEDLRSAAEELENMLTAYPGLSPAEKNRLLKSVLEKVEYTKAQKSKPRDFSLSITPLHFIW